MHEAIAAPLASARRPPAGDLALPAALAALALGEALAVPQQVADPLLAAIAPPLVALPLLWRRSHPLAACWCVTLLFALVAATGTIDADRTSGCSLTMLVAAGSAAAHAASLRAVLLSAAGMSLLGALATGMFADGPPAAGDLLFGLVFVLAAVVLGRAVHGGALRRLRLAVELDGARSERAAAAQAARQERRRLAQELHDLGSHHLVVAALHAAIAGRASAAAEAEAAEPARAAAERARAREAFAVVREAVARVADALAALTAAGGDARPQARPVAGDGGGVVNARRADADADADAATVPPAAPPAAALADALAQAAAQGARVEAPPAEALADVPEAVALTAVRVLQEARTNAAKHAAGGAVSITLRRDGRRLVVAVANEPGGAGTLAGGGLGLTGMAERVRLLGGTLRAGPDGDGWLVRAELPLAAPAARRRGWLVRAELPLAPPAARRRGWLVRAELPLAAPAARRRGWLPSTLRGGCPAWAAAACALLGAWGVAEALVLDDGARAGARLAAALAAAAAPALLWRRPAALVALTAAALALRAWAATIAPTSSPLVLLTALAAYAVAREARTLRGAAGGIAALVVLLQASFLLSAAPRAAPDLGFLPGLVAGAGVAGLLLRLGARDAAALDDELARARARSAAARAAAIAAERRRLEQELIALTHRSLGELRRLVARAERERGRARGATLAAIEAAAAAALADLGRLAAVLRDGS